MPKKYSDEEKAFIAATLKREAVKCLKQYGIKGTTVDVLVERAQIPKGTFYLLYDSKEALLLTVMTEQRNHLEMQIFKKLNEISEAISAEIVANFLYDSIVLAANDEMLNIWNSAEMELIKRKLTPTAYEAYFGASNDLTTKMLAFSNIKLKKKVKTVAYSLKTAYLGYIHSDTDISAETKEDGLRILLSGLASQII